MRIALQQVYALLTPGARRKALLLVLVSLVNALTEVSGLAALFPLLALGSDPGLLQRNPWIGWLYEHSGCSSFGSFYLLIGAGFLCCFLLTNVANLTASVLTHRLTAQVSREMSVKLLDTYLHRPYRWHLTQNSTLLARTVVEEVDLLIHYVVRILANLIIRSVAAGFIIAALVALDYRVALTTGLALCVVYSQIYRFFRRKSAELGRVYQEASQMRIKAATEGLAVVREAPALPRRARLLRRYDQVYQQASKVRLHQQVIGEVPRPCTEILAVAMIVGVLAFLTLTRGQAALPLIGVFIMATWRLVPCLQHVYEDLVEIRFRLPLLNRIHQQLTESSAEQLPEEIGPKLPFTSQIRLEKVSFAYPGEPELALRQVSLTLPRLGCFAIVGPSGAGKSTLTHVLAGLLEPQTGEVLIDAELLTRDLLTRWQQNIGYVPQDVFITDDTVRRNIALGLDDDEIDELAVEKAARAARVHDFIRRRSEGYETMLGERGLALSGGERQRIGIARALYHEPALLILDEATNSLDSQTERQILEAITEISHQRAVLMIAHRLTTVQNCQRITLMSSGFVQAEGSFAELLEQCQDFRSLAACS